MSDTTETNGAEGTKKVSTKGPFATLDEARADKPESDKTKLFTVTAPDGSVSYAWSDGVHGAIRCVAKAHGYTASLTDKVVNKSQLAAGLAALSPEERAELLAQ